MHLKPSSGIYQTKGYKIMGTAEVRDVKLNENLRHSEQ